MAEPFVGEIYMVGFQFAPRDWALCNGQLMSIDQNSALFALLGTTFGGDGETTFGLPDLRGRVPVGMGQGPGLSNYVLGQVAGTETVTLTTTNLPAHTHTPSVGCSSGAGNANTPVNGVWAKNGGLQGVLYSNAANNGSMAAGAVTVAPSGGGQPHQNLQPALCVTFVIALFGIFPSRN